MYIIRRNDSTSESVYLAYNEGNKLNDDNAYDGWFYTDKVTVYYLIKRAFRAKETCTATHSEIYNSLRFLFDTVDQAQEFLNSYCEVSHYWYYCTPDDFVIEQFETAGAVKHATHSFIKEIVKSWKKEAGVKTQVIVSVITERFMDVLCTKVVIGTNRPGSMIGTHGLLIEKYKELLCRNDNDIAIGCIQETNFIV